MTKKNKVFLFVNLVIDGGYFGVHHGIAFLVPIIKRYGYDVHLIQLESAMEIDEFERQVRAHAPDIIGYSFTSLQVKFLAGYSEAIASSMPDVLQIAGGSGATLDPKMTRTAVNGFVVGEGEAPLESLLSIIEQGGDIHQAQGFVWHRNGLPVHTPVPPFARDISELPYPDYSVFSREKVVYDNPAKLGLMISRGCPYNCHYCCNKALKDVYDSSHGYFRVPTVEYAIGLIEAALGDYPETRFLEFEDDLLIAKKKWFLEFAEQYKRRIGLPYRMNVRTECLTPEIVTALKESGCKTAFLGLESGNEQFRAKMLNRKHTNAAIVEKSKLLKDAGIKLFTFNIVGFPNETKEQMLDTLRLNQEIQPDTGVCTYFFPFPGTELYHICQREGFLEGLDFEQLPSNYNTAPIIPRTQREKKECVEVMNQINAFFQWQNFKYNLRLYRESNNAISVAFHVLRALAFLGVQRVLSHNAQLRIYHALQNNPVSRPVLRMLLKGVR